MIREQAPAKLNLVLQVGRPRSDGLHEICSIFASLELSDELTFLASDTDGDEVVCPSLSFIAMTSLRVSEIFPTMPV